MPKGGSKPGERRGGRKAGTPNKVGGALKDMIMESLNAAGGVNYLIAQAAENPKTYLLLLGRVLPMQVSGDSEQPLEHIFRWAGNVAEAVKDPSRDDD